MKKSHSEATLRETYVILVAWIVFCGWTLFWSATHGFWAKDSGSIETVFGLPAWVAWGVGLPWFAATAFTTWFCLGFMQDDEGDDNEDEGAVRG